MNSQIVDDLVTAKFEGGVTLPPSRRGGEFSMEDGYGAMAQLDSILRQRGYRAVGRKIGFTNRDTWDEFNLDTPMWAHVYEQTVLHARQGEIEISLEKTVAPRLEPEVVLCLAEDIKEPGKTPLEILSALEWIAMGFEIVDCHYRDWNFTAADAVADYGLHNRLLIGPPLDIEGLDLAAVPQKLAGLAASMFKDGAKVAEGCGAKALGSPLLALGFLVEVISKQPWAEPLRAGEVVTTGTLTPLPYIHPGETWRVETDGMGLALLTLRTV